MDVIEIFGSIQGESTRVGVPCVFVRLAGCNLDCSWCDTRYARKGGTRMSRDDIVEKVVEFDVTEVCVTGGEPMLQPDTPLLLEALVNRGLRCTLMTNGSLPLDAVPDAVIRVMDVKTPWSQANQPRTRPATGAHPSGLKDDNLRLLRPHDEVKFVIGTREDFDWACEWALCEGLFDRVAAVFVSPAWGMIEPSIVADWIVESGLPLRLNLQVHKLLWGADTRL